MKLHKLITGLIIALLLPVASVAETYTADGVTYDLSGSTATITSIDNNATKLIIRKSITYGGTTYTMKKLSSGSIFSNSQAKTVKWVGAWTEPDLTGAQFYNFKNIEAYEVDSVNTNISDGNGRLEVYDGVLYVYHSEGEKHLLAYPCKKNATSYTVREMTQIIMGSAFRNNEFLRTVDLNPQVKIVRNEAFAGTTSLTAVNAFPNTSYENTSYDDKEDTTVIENQYFETISGVLFQNNTRTGSEGYTVNFPAAETFHKTLVVYPVGKTETGYNIPDGTEVLGRSCFYGAKNLTSIGFESGAAEDLIEIRENAFNHCENLTTFQIPANVQYINMKYNDPPINPVGSGVQTGSGTYSYTSAPIHAGDAIGSFDYCYKLVLSIDENNPNFMVENTYNGSTLLSNVLLSKDKTRLVRYGCTTTFKGYMVPREVEYIDSYAFSETNVAHVVLPSKLTYVSRNIFENAKKLEFITIPPMVTDIKQDMLKGCTSLTQVFMMPETPPTLANANVFGTSNPTIYVKPNKTVNNANNFGANITKDIYDAYKAKANYPSSRIEYDIPVTLNAYGMATMCRDFAVELNSDLIAYFLTNETGVPNEPTETLTFMPTNCRNTAMEEGRFIPARTGKDYGDYRGVVLKTAEEYNPSKNYTYQISVEDFNNTFNLRGKNQTNGSNYYPDASFTFKDGEFESGQHKGTNISATNDAVQEITNCSVSYDQIGYTETEGNIVTTTHDGKYYHKMNNDTKSYITITLNDSKQIQSGDKIIATLFDNNTAEGGFKFKTTTGTSHTISYSHDKEDVLEYILTSADIDNGTLTIYRANTNTYVRNIQIISAHKANTKPRTIHASQYIIGVPVETNITIYDGEFTTFGLKGDKFQRTAKDGTVPYNKAYMRLPSATIPGKVPGSEVSNDAKFILVFQNIDEIDLNDMETTAIQDINTEAASIANAGIVYNLQGYPVGNAETLQQGSLPKGMYILNGKKYIVR